MPCLRCPAACPACTLPLLPTLCLASPCCAAAHTAPLPALPRLPTHCSHCPAPCALAVLLFCLPKGSQRDPTACCFPTLPSSAQPFSHQLLQSQRFPSACPGCWNPHTDCRGYTHSHAPHHSSFPWAHPTCPYGQAAPNSAYFFPHPQHLCILPCSLFSSHRAQAIIYTRASLCKPHQNINKTYPSATHCQRQHLTPGKGFHLFWPSLHTRLTPHPTYTPLLLKTVTHSWSVNTPVDPKPTTTKEHIFHLLRSGHWEERQQGSVIGLLVEADLKTQPACYHLRNVVTTLATALTSVTGQLPYRLCHKVFTCTHCMTIPHWHLPSRLFSNNALRSKSYGRNKCSESNVSLHQSCSTYANAQVLAPGLRCVSPKHSIPSSIPIYFTDSTYSIAPTLPQEWLPKLSAQLRHHEYIHPSRTDFHAIQVNSALLAGQATLWLPNQETGPLDVDAVCPERRLRLRRALFTLSTCPLVFNEIAKNFCRIYYYFCSKTYIRIPLRLMLCENRPRANPYAKQNIS